MTFVSPIWCLALLPWAGVAIYLLLGRSPSADVPALFLWRTPIVAARTKRSFHRISLWVLLLLSAAAMAIFSAAGPRLMASASSTFPPTTQASPSIAVEALVVRGNQAMMRIFNSSTAANSGIIVTSDGRAATYPIDLPPAGQSRNYFFDVPANVTRVRASVPSLFPQGDDTVAVEVIRQRSWPKLEAISPLPDDVRRMVDVYRRARPTSASSVQIAMAAGETKAPVGEPAVQLADASSPASGTPMIAAHAVTANVDWATALSDARIVADPSRDWTPLVSVDGKMVVGVRDTPARQIWVGFDSPAFARSPAFVIFWTNIFDWVGQGGDEFVATPGTHFASNAAPAATGKPATGRDLSPWLACLAVGLSAAAIAVIPRRFP